jgi:hypothetical protein
VVEPLAGPAEPPPATPQLPPDAVRAAFEQLHDQAQQALQGIGAATAERDALSALRDRLLRQLGLLP